MCFDIRNKDLISLDVYEEWGETIKRDEDIRNLSLSAMQIILLAINKESDTWTIIYFEKDKLAIC